MCVALKVLALQDRAVELQPAAHRSMRAGWNDTGAARWLRDYARQPLHVSGRVGEALTGE